jgi:glycosyltransferase involved in cell wall biosynthesis
LREKNQFAGVILHSKYAAQSFLETGFSEKRLLVAHNAINLSELQDEELSKEELRKELGLPELQQIVTYSGRVSPEKGLQRLLDLAGHFPKVLFVIVGSEKEGPIEKEAETIPNVKVVGWQDKKTVFQYLKASDVLYIPTSTRARDQAGNTVLPLKTFIYKASGTAILAPDMADIREVLSDEENAILVKPDDIQKEIQGLKILLEDANLREKLGEKAAREIKSNTWEFRADKVVNFIQKRI